MSMKRVLRILEYVGNKEWIDYWMSKRAVMGKLSPAPGVVIRELAVIEDMFEIHEEADARSAKEDSKS